MQCMRLLWVGLLAVSLSESVLAAGAKDYHCEVKKKGKSYDLPKSEAPNRKACKAKGGKWIKDHADHDHGEGSDHDHSEDE